jgi:hypothetical protein
MKCDLISIDGSHIPPQPFHDIYHFRMMAHANTFMLLDDMDRGVKEDLDKAVASGIAKEEECLTGDYFTDVTFAGVKQYKHVFCRASYIL